MRTVSDIIKDCGGPGRIAESIADAFPPRANGEPALTSEAVYKWPRIGIPDRYWPVLRTLTEVTPAELYEANVAAREGAAA